MWQNQPLTTTSVVGILGKRENIASEEELLFLNFGAITE